MSVDLRVLCTGVIRGDVSLAAGTVGVAGPDASAMRSRRTLCEAPSQHGRGADQVRAGGSPVHQPAARTIRLNASAAVTDTVCHWIDASRG